MIEFQQVSKAFGGKQILTELNWRIEAGECWHVTGASGIGKTTLLRLLMGLEKPDCGRIIGIAAVRFAPVFQEDRLIETMNAGENVALVCDDRKAIHTLLCRLLPETALEQPVRTLSGGMRRRVALVRALLAPSDVLVLDEPFTGLDIENIKNTVKAIYDYSQERTVVLVSHGTETLFHDWKNLRLDA